MQKNENIISQLKSYVKNGSLQNEEPVIELNFWLKNRQKIIKMIRYDEFSKDDFDIISKAFEKLESYKSIRYIDNQYNEPFKDVCKSYIALSLKYYKDINKYLILFDPETAYYKKIKALSMYKFYNGPIENIKTLFGEICTLLGEAIEKEPETAKECYNIMKGYLEIVYTTVCLTTESRVDFIFKYGNSKYRNDILNNSSFREWFDGLNKLDERLLSLKGINELMVGIIDKYSGNGNIPSKTKIKKLLGNLFDEYTELQNEYNQQKKIFNEMDAEYDRLADELHQHYNKGDRDIVIDFVSVYNDDMVNLIKERLESGEIDNTYTIHIAFRDGISKEQKDLVKKEYENSFKELGLKIEFMDENDNDEIVMLHKKLGGLQGALSEEGYKYMNLENAVYHQGNEIIQRTIEICNNYDELKDTDIKEKTEDNLDRKDADDAIEKVNKLCYELENRKRMYDELSDNYSQLLSRYERVIDILEEHGIVLNDIAPVRKRGRENYRIGIIGGHQNTNKSFNNMLKNEKFYEKKIMPLGISWNQWTDLKITGDYDKQKNTDIAKTIANRLIQGKDDFVIILKSDHETELANLMSNPEFRSRITYFGETEENGKLAKYDQNFSPLRFYYYLDRAINKFEINNENNNIGI